MIVLGEAGDRQREVLQSSAEDKVMKEVGGILNMTARTASDPPTRDNPRFRTSTLEWLELKAWKMFRADPDSGERSEGVLTEDKPIRGGNCYSMLISSISIECGYTPSLQKRGTNRLRGVGVFGVLLKF